MPTRRRRLKEQGHFFHAAVPDADMDVILPSQFLPARKLTAEQALMLAVLEDAEDCIRKGQCFRVSPKKRAQHDQDMEWLASRDRSDVMSFENICLVLGFDIESTRERLLGMRGSEAPVRTPTPEILVQRAGTAERMRRHRERIREAS